MVSSPHLSKFEVKFDACRQLLQWTLRGFWTVEDVLDYSVAMRRAIATFGPPPHDYDGLGDAREFPVQRDEVDAALHRFGSSVRPFHRGRTAIVVGSTLNKLQVERRFDIENKVRIFLSMDEARDWLSTEARAAA